ncbi:MAG TPA: MEKHLA domain-containing protein [Candidatus Binatia bacterium]|nr:MEKHLA domain-containing protein [Candidatus Binatia bacterium]
MRDSRSEHNPSEPDAHNRYLATHVALLASSFRRWTGRNLIEPDRSDESQARALYFAPFAILSHDSRPEPILNYANRTGLRLFELTWSELIVMPSRLTAQAPDQADRARLLSQVAAQGFIDDYRGVRITKTGRRFLIERATVWNLVDDEGRFQGQAATFKEWRFID